MKHSKVYTHIIAAVNEEIAEQTALIDLIKEINTEDDAKIDAIDRELERLFKLVHLKNEIASLLNDKEEKGEI